MSVRVTVFCSMRFLSLIRFYDQIELEKSLNHTSLIYKKIKDFSVFVFCPHDSNSNFKTKFCFVKCLISFSHPVKGNIELSKEFRVFLVRDIFYFFLKNYIIKV